MMSFRASDSEATKAQEWADALGIDKSELLRDALHRHLVELASQNEPKLWEENPLTADEVAISQIADWGPAEDWEDWGETGPANEKG